MSDWTTMPRREKWAWAYLVFSLLYLTYTIIGLCCGGEWLPLACAAGFSAAAVLFLIAVRRGHAGK